MALIPWPTLTRRLPPTMRWRLLSNTQVATSPLSGGTQTQELPGARWAVSFGYRDLSAPDAALLRAFLARMRGQANCVELWPFDCERPRGNAGAATGIFVAGAGQTGASIAVDGAPLSTTAWLRAGDMLQIGAQLMMTATDTNTDAGGAATIAIEPPLRASPADNAPVVLIRPRARFMLASSEVGWSVEPGLYTSIELDFIEAFA